VSEPATISVAHGAADLQVVTVDAYDAELRDAEGSVGDRAGRSARHRPLGRADDRHRLGNARFTNRRLAKS